MGQVAQVAENVFLAAGTHVNWVLLRDGQDLTLVDGGWYGDYAAVESSVRAIGHRLEDVRAILLTHAHIDHIGSVQRLQERYRIPVYASPREAAHARREFLEQATPADLARHAWRPAALRWTLQITRAGALRRLAVPHAEPFPTTAGPLDLPGQPVPVPCPGHTSGHTAYHLPQAGILISGDALVTGHPLSRTVGPQLLPGFFTHSPAEATASLDALAAIDAGVLLPGHGRPWKGPVSASVAQAAG